MRITSTAICGSDLHPYSKLAPVMHEGEILGHEPMGIVEEVGRDVRSLAAGYRVVIPFNIACGHCFFCRRGLQSQCETTQNKTFKKGGSLFGYTEAYGGVPGGQAEYLRVPLADYGPIKIPQEPPDERFLYLSDVLPTAWQGVRYAQVSPGDTVGVWGLGPIGQMCVRVALHHGAGRVIGIDRVAERLAMARRHGADAIELDDITEAIWDLTDGRGLDSGIDAVGGGGIHRGFRPAGHQAAAGQARRARNVPGVHQAGRHLLDPGSVRRMVPDSSGRSHGQADHSKNGSGECPPVDR